jgi:lysyl-tRNA synthetase class 2
MTRICINDTIFETHPGFYRAVLIVRDAKNRTADPALNGALSAIASERVGVDVNGLPAVRAWDAAHIKCGSNPNKYPPSAKALLKRISAGHTIPFINSAVALFNFISIKHALPCGGDDLAKITGDLVLGISDGSEMFAPISQPDKPEHPERGEVIYFDRGSKQVMYRRWNWRNGDLTKLQLSTRDMVINIDCIPPIPKDVANLAQHELATLLVSHCNARVAVDFLDSTRRAIPLIES